MVLREICIVADRRKHAYDIMLISTITMNVDAARSTAL